MGPTVNIFFDGKTKGKLRQDLRKNNHNVHNASHSCHQVDSAVNPKCSALELTLQHRETPTETSLDSFKCVRSISRSVSLSLSLIHFSLFPHITLSRYPLSCFPTPLSHFLIRSQLPISHSRRKKTFYKHCFQLGRLLSGTCEKMLTLSLSLSFSLTHTSTLERLRWHSLTHTRAQSYFPIKAR